MFTGFFSANLPLLVKTASLAAGLVAWEIYGATRDHSLTIVPLSDVLVALSDLITQSEFRSAFWETLKPFFIGLALALVVGIPLGLLIGQYALLRVALSPYLNFLNALPISALIPIIVIGLGIGLRSRVAVIFLFAIVEVTLNAAAGAWYVRKDLVQMARSFGANRLKTFWRVILPGSLPGVMAGVRLGTGRAVVGMVVAELLLVSVGVGRLISLYRGRYQTDDLYATVLAISLLGILLLEIVRQVERRVLHWKTEGRR